MKVLAVAATVCVLSISGCVNHSGGPSGAAQQPRASVEFRVERDWAYGTERTLAQRADLYLPEGPGPFPGMVVVHGGGWDARDRSDMDSISRKLARRGYVVANIDYRLAPQALFPAPLEDVRTAVRWLRGNAARFRLDPTRIGGWGYSAGAHLVALAAAGDADPEARLQAVVAGGTPADLPHYPVSPIITRFIGAPYAQAAAAWQEASPLSHVGAGDPPVFLYHGTWDRLVSLHDAYAMKQALDRAAVPAELYLVRGGGHITTFLFGFGAERAGLDFLDRVLRPAPG